MSDGRPDPLPRLLIELVTDPRDPGYEAAARRHDGRPAHHWYDQPLVALGCLIIGFVLVLAYVHTHRSAPEAAQVRQSLIDRVHRAEQQDHTLAAAVGRLTDRLNSERSSALAGDTGLTRELDADQLLAGQVAVTGPGIQVTLAEPPAPSPTAQPGRVGTVSIATTHILSDRDVRSVVNELWADGAEAISVNDVRLTPTSAIRFAGQAVLVDFQPIASPYVIRAIGPADQLDTSFAASDVAGRYKTLAGADGIGFEFAEAAHLHLPAAAADTPRYAHVPTPAPTTSGPKRGNR